MTSPPTPPSWAGSDPGPTHERNHVRGVDLPGIRHTIGEHGDQEFPDIPGVVAPRSRTHAADPAQMLIVGRQQCAHRHFIINFHRTAPCFPS